MIRHFAYSTFALTLSSLVVLTTHPFLRESASPVAPVLIALSTGVIYFLIFRKLFRRYRRLPSPFRGGAVVLAATTLLPPVLWLSITQWTAPWILAPMLLAVLIGILAASRVTAVAQSQPHPPSP